MKHPAPHSLPFMKMHGLGNDFVVLDARASAMVVTGDMAKGVAHRHFGVGFDQLAVLSRGTEDGHLTFFNADGSMSSACGNATRCIARYLFDDAGKNLVRLTTDRGVLIAEDRGNEITAVNMGQPLLNWKDVPLAREMDTLTLPMEGGPTATGMGNPHCSFFVDNVAAVDLSKMGPRVEHDPLFPERTNVQFAQLVGKDHLRMRVWERGVGITLASGSSSCAVAVAAARKGLTGRNVRIDLDGGTLHVEWQEDGVWMIGPTMHVFNGTLTRQFLQSIL
ncbi:MAG: diaminopimelate epimerase [Pseudomonadota bacterium]